MIKTIKELEANGCNITNNGWNNHSIGYLDALKDMLGLIDDKLQRLRGAYQRYNTQSIADKIKLLEELKKRING